MYTLTKQFRFEAAHQLHKHDGKCARLHGHSWIGRVIVQGKELVGAGPKSGMLIDYTQLTEIVQPLVDNYLDHHHLNETTKLENPTSEELARWIYNKLASKLWDGVTLIAVQIDETCTCSAEYRSDL